MSWNWQDIALPVGVGLLGFAVGLVLLGVGLARRRARSRVRDINLTPADLGQMRSDLADLAAQLEDFAKVIDKSVGERLGQLQALVGEADARIRQLRQLASESAKDRPLAAQGGQTEKIIALASEGLDCVEIARRLRIDVGQVELTVNLHGGPRSQNLTGSGRR